MRRVEWAFPVLSGVLWTLCFPKPDLSWLAWVALAPLFWSLSRAESWSEAAWKGGLAGFVFYAGLMSWIYETCRFAKLSPPVALAAWLALAAVMALHWMLFAAGLPIARRVFGSVPGGAWAAWWVGVEWLSARWTTQFPWGLAGYTQWRNDALLPVAGALGVYGLSFLVVLVNAAVARSFESRRTALGELSVAGLAAFGFLFLGRALGPKGEVKPDLEIAVLQANVDQYQKWDKDFERAILENYAELAAQAQGVQLVVWPESALPGWYDDAHYSAWLSAVAAKTGTFHLVGAAMHSGAGAKNAAILLDVEGAAKGIYAKRQLVPFGERVPPGLEKLVPVLNELGGFEAGASEAPRLKLFWGELAVGICYEAIFPHLFRHNGTEGGRVLVNLTNDGWYRDTAGPYQHFAMAVLRAAENRAYLIRAANTGISALVDPYGRVLERTRIDERVVMRAKLDFDKAHMAPSLYATFGDVFPALCLGLCVVLVPLGVLDRRWERRAAESKAAKAAKAQEGAA